MKKKPNIILYTILMFFVFVFIVEGIIYGFGGPIMYQAISDFPQGSLVVTEAVLHHLRPCRILCRQERPGDLAV